MPAPESHPSESRASVPSTTASSCGPRHLPPPSPPSSAGAPPTSAFPQGLQAYMDMLRPTD